MNSKKLAIAVVSIGLCTLALALVSTEAEEKPAQKSEQASRPASQFDDRTLEPRLKQMVAEEKEMETEAEEKNQRAKALEEKKKTLSDEAERARIDEQIKKLEHEHENLLGKIRQHAVLRKEVEDRIRTRRKNKN